MPVLPIRLPWAMLRGRRRTTLALDGESVLDLRVRVSDVDWWAHMNNGRYLTNLDLGRTDLIMRNGMARTMRELRWKPVVAAATIRYSRSLQPLSRYRLRKRIAGWEGRSFYFDQRFEQDGRVAARAWVRVAVTSATGTVDAADAMESMGWSGPPPELPADVTAWRAADRS